MSGYSLLPFLLSLLCYQLILTSSSSSSSDCEGPAIFSFPSFNTTSCKSGGGLRCMGAVVSGEGFLNLTAGPMTATPDDKTVTAVEKADLDKVGRVLYEKPVRPWPASFSTSFTLRIFPHLSTQYAGDGMAFVIAQDNHPSPLLSIRFHLGLYDVTIAGDTKFQQLAVEFDTLENDYDPDDNYIVIYTKITSTFLVAKSPNSTLIDLKSGKRIKVKIKYNKCEKLLQIYVGDNPLIKVSKLLPSQVYVGFTPATGALAETHQVLDWVFTSTASPCSTLKDHKKKTKINFKSVLPIFGALILFVLCAFPIIRRRMINKKERLKRMEDIERRSATKAPKKFTYKQLAKATKNFSKDNLLGSGGFGSVYKGNITEPPHTIAVKKNSAYSEQGEREYLAEICTIGRMKHKNLMQLHGWCHENEHLLLVYEFMPNKSLHQFINGDFIDWKTRHKILTGLASALLYLHEECGDPVVHRDVKPSNIMLDLEFNPRLGDFGLARLLKNTTEVTTMMAGTLGYMAPELSYTGKATTEADVYSFGVVALEVVSGKRFNKLLGEICLVDYAWEMYTKGCLQGCVDPRLEEEFEQDQATRMLTVALACLHLDPSSRPTMRKVVQILMNPNETLMNLPDARPCGVYVSIYGFSNPPSVNDSSPSTSVSTLPNYYDE